MLRNQQPNKQKQSRRNRVEKTQVEEKYKGGGEKEVAGVCFFVAVVFAVKFRQYICALQSIIGIYYHYTT